MIKKKFKTQMIRSSTYFRQFLFLVIFPTDSFPQVEKCLKFLAKEKYSALKHTVRVADVNRCGEIKLSLVYIASSRSAGTTDRPCPKKTKRKSKLLSQGTQDVLFHHVCKELSEVMLNFLDDVVKNVLITQKT